MPYEWVRPYAKAPEQSGAFCDDPLAELHLWPYRSLPRKGFVLMIAATAMLLALPLVQVLGTPVLWGLLPFILLAVWALWYALNRSYSDGEIVEELRLWPERITLLRRSRKGEQRWEANPHWTRVNIHESGGPVPQYLTLKGAGREVEIGAFLTEEERLRLYDDIREMLAR